MNKTLQKIGLAAGLAASISLTAVLTTGCAGDRYSRSTGTYVDDAAISTKVKTQLLADKEVKGTEVHVRTYNGEVQLSGFVDTEMQRSRAVEIARAIDGVRAVRNDLVVKVAAAAQAPSVREPSGAQNQQ